MSKTVHRFLLLLLIDPCFADDVVAVRSLGQGNVFTCVCHSVNREGSLSLVPCSFWEGGSVSRGSQSMASQSIGFSVWGLCPGGLCRETTPESEKQTVHMLLECFLVSNISVRELQFKCILTIYVDQAMVFILTHTLRL